MKKNIFFAMMLAMVGFALTSCGDKESEGKSRFTYYAVLTMNGEDVTSKIQVSSNVDTSKPGWYKVNYVVYNDDNFPASASRDVMVVDPNNFASTYFGESQYGSRHYYDAPLNITRRGDGTYLIDDIAGGFYCYGRYPGYEPTYDFHLESVIKLNDDNTIELVNQNPGAWYWGQAITITSGTYDPATGTITLVLDFDGTPMYVTLTK